MKTILENLLALLWNLFAPQSSAPAETGALELGTRIVDGQVTRNHLVIQQDRRAEHIVLIGKTGSGKSFLLRSLAKQDIQSGRGFVFFDLHGDETPFLVATVAEHEKRVKRNLSDRLIIIEPADPTASVGLNPLEPQGATDRFVQTVEFAQILQQRWHLEFGARTDELLRNCIYVLIENRFTLLELAPLLSDSAFRARCLRSVTNPEVKLFFELRYDRASEAMQGVLREPILNKVTAFTADTNFRHIIGQRYSTFSILDAMDRGSWIILNLHKGRLGEQAITLGSLFLTKIKHALFSRKSRQLFTLYCDEIQNLVAFGSGLETILSESRKFGISVTSANQFLDQYPPEMRAAILAVGTHAFFQLSSADAHQIATALDGGKSLSELLKNLPRRHFVLKTGHHRWQEGVVTTLREPSIDPSDLYARCRARWARLRTDVETDIRQRQAIVGRGTNEALNDWE